MNHLHALCIARHRLLSDHLSRVFVDTGADTSCVVGLEAAAAYLDQGSKPDVLVVEYDLLASAPPELHDTINRLGTYPIVAVSMTHRVSEMHPLDKIAVSAFVYLPVASPDSLRRTLYAAAAGQPDTSLGASLNASLDLPRTVL